MLVSKQAEEAETLNIEQSSSDKRFWAFGEGFMAGFDGIVPDNPYLMAFEYPLHSWWSKGYNCGKACAKGLDA